MTCSRSAPMPARTLSRPSLAAILFVAALAVLAIPFAALLAQASERPFTVEETGLSYASLQQAVDAIGDSRATISIAPGRYRQCAVQEAGVITYEASRYGTAVLEGRACEGKAALVLRGSGAEVKGLVLRGISVGDGNGAGIRLENGALNVAFTTFAESQQGLLTGVVPNARIHITRSTFTRLGTCENSAGCAHSIYIGDVPELTLRESRFEQGTGGHYVKSRAAVNVIEGNSFDDSAGSGTNYMIDLPAGTRGRIAGNWFVQGREKENYSAFIALGAEDRLHPSDGLEIAGNEARFVPGLRRSSAFLADWTGERVALSGNRLAEGIEEYERR
ncbi:MAG: right-handed parallel beta-helix repeat-containing protein [Erythrobacter sp.]|uniref:right-handed parallel beta-helix repeat-containing protein n=1 Tax=Erythrobacter sp. TaxID=1042 RepID=UPI0032EB2236